MCLEIKVIIDVTKAKGPTKCHALNHVQVQVCYLLFEGGLIFFDQSKNVLNYRNGISNYSVWTLREDLSRAEVANLKKRIR